MFLIRNAEWQHLSEWSPVFIYYEDLIINYPLNLALISHFPLTRPSRRPLLRCTGDPCIGGQRQNFVPSPTQGQAWIPQLHSLPRARRHLQPRRRCYWSPRLRPNPRCCPIPPSFLSSDQSPLHNRRGRGPGNYLRFNYSLIKPQKLLLYVALSWQSKRSRSRPPFGRMRVRNERACKRIANANAHFFRTTLRGGSAHKQAHSRSGGKTLEWACGIPPTIMVTKPSGVWCVFILHDIWKRCRFCFDWGWSFTCIRIMHIF